MRIFSSVRFTRIAITIGLSLSFFLSTKESHAIGIDLLGEVASPLIGPAKDKVKGMLRYIWMQPYAGYATGTSSQTRTAPSGLKTVANDLSVEGFFYGARGGLLILDNIRIGLDYSIQSAKRNTLAETTVGTYLQQSTSGKNSMLGACFGFDIPYTPLQGYAAKYFKANLSGDAAANGEGWGAGVSFVLKNPFILLVETRQLNYSSDPEASGKSADGTMSQYYVGLSFMLF